MPLLQQSPKASNELSTSMLTNPMLSPTSQGSTYRKKKQNFKHGGASSPTQQAQVNFETRPGSLDIDISGNNLINREDHHVNAIQHQEDNEVKID